mmetsp:Transcript_12960/g.43855  ORF Transcript_12960/g.43855 Transcript_12960/m.43855 type:complete len:216 (+) Transcript_12960:2001-2648(+)
MVTRRLLRVDSKSRLATQYTTASTTARSAIWARSTSVAVRGTLTLMQWPMFTGLLYDRWPSVTMPLPARAPTERLLSTVLLMTVMYSSEESASRNFWNCARLSRMLMASESISTLSAWSCMAGTRSHTRAWSAMKRACSVSDAWALTTCTTRCITPRSCAWLVMAPTREVAVSTLSSDMSPSMSSTRCTMASSSSTRAWCSGASVHDVSPVEALK